MKNYAAPDSLPPEIRERLAAHRVSRSLRRPSRVFIDTTDFSSIDYGDIIRIEDRYFLITAYTKEGRFGVDEQIKPWVPRVEELASGNKYIIKLVFYETFEIRLGHYLITYYRTPEKEASILEQMSGHPHFMQGEALLDSADNLVRVLVPINGTRLDKYIHRQRCSHEEYFFTLLPSVLRRYLKAVEAIGLLHAKGFRHGDIRRDHIFVERSSGIFSWIDFDYDFYLPERPFALDIYELGNILLYLIGRGNYHPREIADSPELGSAALNSLEESDLSLLSQNRVVNLKKLFPYIPEKLNTILLHFSTASNVFYESAEELHTDLAAAVEDFDQIP
ncbi:protein kinase family protein [Desulfogranum mediterraneum]|uniref:hypothetical protein n=1 Tax=Desulfogranum mediterraneum TaxID=160661 RepID=UPI0004018E5B|nr:hypothetical protein [Desulfogranum mediterraneum]